MGLKKVTTSQISEDEQTAEETPQDAVDEIPMAPAPVVERPKMYVTKTLDLRDPFSKILYTNTIPMPAGHAGWLRCQIAAGVIVEYTPSSPEPAP